MSRRTDLQKLIELNSRYLQKLKEQQAVKGVDAEPGLLIEIEDKENELAKLRTELEALEAEPLHAAPSQRVAGLSWWWIGLIGVVGLGLVCGISLVVTTGGRLVYMFSGFTASPETSTPVNIVLLPTPTPPPLLPTPTRTPRPNIITITPNPACPNTAQISSPHSGDRVSGDVKVIGAASIDNFDYYKLEFRPLGGDEWDFIQSYDDPITGGWLGTWDTKPLIPGEYEFRLVVVDIVGNFLEPCVIQLLVQ